MRFVATKSIENQITEGRPYEGQFMMDPAMLRKESGEIAYRTLLIIFDNMKRWCIHDPAIFIPETELRPKLEVLK